MRPLLAEMPPARRKGLSLVELLVVIAIIAIVFAMVIVTVAKIWKVVMKFKEGH